MQVIENKHTTLKKVVAVVVLIILLVVIAGVFYLQARDQDEKRFRDLVRQVNGRVEDGHNDRTIEGFEDYIKSSPFPTHKPDAMVYLANAYEAKGDLEGSLKWYHEIEKLGKANAVVYEGIAFNARRLGDKEKAKEYYRKAIELRKQDNDPSQSTLRINEEALKALEQGE